MYTSQGRRGTQLAQTQKEDRHRHICGASNCNGGNYRKEAVSLIAKNNETDPGSGNARGRSGRRSATPQRIALAFREVVVRRIKDGRRSAQRTQRLWAPRPCARKKPEERWPWHIGEPRPLPPPRSPRELTRPARTEGGVAHAAINFQFAPAHTTQEFALKGAAALPHPAKREGGHHSQ
ncbi:hypothetical protein HPB50_004427 [Hyalomma asiaticum]|uniref:Uncharacterized protein n=1 Tax=Hyalomma asiaticum TaxID=266040 RepID=A0ACB7TCJ2_HYAAI|nr:hypothetical protein HPB50_004427 [Hyalomma asiaticum]